LQVVDVSSSFRLFENVVKYFDAFLNLIPLSFVLGFYVSYVASRKATSF
jgi:bestrophin-3